MSTFHRPTPLPDPSGDPIDRRFPPDAAVRRLLDGDTLWVRDHYLTGVDVIEAFVAQLRPDESADFPTKQRYREAYRTHAFRLLARVRDGRVDLPGAPDIGFLQELYPDRTAFWLPFPEIRHLAHSWHRYDRGMPMPVLGHPLHPFYGTYLPKRTAHLELFGTWLSAWKGARDRAIDVGTGSGVLAFMLARAGFSEVLATDTNPNACESVRRDVQRRPEPPPITVQDADLLGDSDAPADLVVFNPPWTRGPVETLLDRALNYDDPALFERFFDQAEQRLAPGGRVVLVFSNVTQLVRADDPHPIEVELERGRFVRVNQLKRRIKPLPGRRRTRERVEVWELARAVDPLPA